MTYNSDEEGQDEATYRGTFRELAGDSLALLTLSLLPVHCGNAAVIDKVLSLEFFGRLIGAFEMNNISVEFATRSEEEIEAQGKEGLGAAAGEGFEGTGLFPLVCSANHSCDPNAWVDFDSGDSKAWMYALRDVCVGEEILIAYVDTEGGTDERRRSLLEYGFFCMCKRCCSDENVSQRASFGA